MLAARREQKLRDVVREIKESGGRAAAVACDVDDPDQCVRLVAETIDRFGSIYSIFANAGYGVEKPIHEMSDAEIRGIFETNFFGTINTIRPALPHLLAARRGHVLICSSCLARAAMPLVGAYSATKAAQDHIARAMRIELKPRGVNVSSVHPIGTTTEFFDQMAAKRGSPAADHSIERTPRFLLQPPSRVADAVVACLRSPRPEVWTSWIARLGFAAVDFAPRLVDSMLSRRFSAKSP